MDGWAAQRRQSTDNGNQPAAKMRALSPSEDAETLRKAVLLVSKMTLRQLQSAVFKTYILKKGQAPASGMSRELQALVDRLTEIVSKK